MTDKITSVWIFDTNRRRYETDSNGHNRAVYSYHWHEVDIVDETSRSWVTRSGRKISKKDQPHDVRNTYDEVLDDIFIHDNKYDVVEKIKRLNNASDLRKIMEILL